jgi:thymidylate kinase
MRWRRLKTTRNAQPGRKGFIVVFIGIDGSGKTTAAKLTQSRLSKGRAECSYVWGRFGSILIDGLVIVSKKTIFRQTLDKKPDDDFQRAKSYVFRNRFTGLLYTSFVLVDYIWQLLSKIWLPHFRRINLVCDRYFYDTIIDLTVDLAYSTDTCQRLLKVFHLLAPRPDVTFLIDLPVEVAFARKEDIPSLEYLRRRRELYNHVSGKYGFVPLDGAESPETIVEMGMQRISERLRISR